MKKLFSVSSNAYLFWRISRTPSLKHCMSQYERCFCTIKVAEGSHSQVFSKAVINSKKQKNIGKRFSSNTENSVMLMDFDVWMTPKAFHTIRSFYNYLFALKDLDNFSLPEFTRCSTKALQVVTTLLSQLRFSELEGLLTPECKDEVEKNLKNWSKSQLTDLAIKPEQEMTSIPCDIIIFSDEKNKEKLFAEVRVIHYVWLQYPGEFQKRDPFVSAIERRLIQQAKAGASYVGTVFNCKFLKEVTKGVTDQWIISAINLKTFPEVVKMV